MPQESNVGVQCHSLWVGAAYRLQYGIRILVLYPGDRRYPGRVYLAAEKIVHKLVPVGIGFSSNVG